MYTHIKDNIYSIYVDLPNNPLKNTNAYLIKGKDRNLLIDTGFRLDACRRALNAGLSELGVSMEDTDIFLTHMHADHTGLAPEIAGKSTKIFMSDEDATRLIHSGTADARIESTNMQRTCGFTEEQLMKSPHLINIDMTSDQYEDYVRLDDGAILEYGGHKLQAILTPGHSPGHMCLYDADDKIMFLGDHVLFDVTPNITPWKDFPDPLGSYVNSLLDISGYEVDLPLPAHRGASGSMSDRVGSIIEHHGRRVKELADALDIYPGSTTYELASHMSWNIRFDGDWENFPLSQKFFAVGEMRAHIDYLVIRGRAIRERRGDFYYFYPAKMQRTHS